MFNLPLEVVIWTNTPAHVHTHTNSIWIPLFQKKRKKSCSSSTTQKKTIFKRTKKKNTWSKHCIWLYEMVSNRLHEHRLSRFAVGFSAGDTVWGLLCWERKLCDTTNLSDSYVTRAAVCFGWRSSDVLTELTETGFEAVVGTVKMNRHAVNQARDSYLPSHLFFELTWDACHGSLTWLKRENWWLKKQWSNKKCPFMNKMINRPVRRKMRCFCSLVMDIIYSSWSPCGSPFLFHFPWSS